MDFGAEGATPEVMEACVTFACVSAAVDRRLAQTHHCLHQQSLAVLHAHQREGGRVVVAVWLAEATALVVVVMGVGVGKEDVGVLYGVAVGAV